MCASFVWSGTLHKFFIIRVEQPHLAASALKKSDTQSTNGFMFYSSFFNLHCFLLLTLSLIRTFSKFLFPFDIFWTISKMIFKWKPQEVSVYKTSICVYIYMYRSTRKKKLPEPSWTQRDQMHLFENKAHHVGPLMYVVLFLTAKSYAECALKNHPNPSGNSAKILDSLDLLLLSL